MSGAPHWQQVTLMSVSDSRLTFWDANRITAASYCFLDILYVSGMGLRSKILT